ncbi:A disintegrin and metalloproteinase with thrombospondin motifs 16 [Plakobranchus ocellatus]|uniref:A disintegrin and metalloproteinase with thrombospondin motifs 16 n=1 Tax=Plakobranchus ocellatus TaxID=259542 RepID=A0AAV4A0B6_9GAST|nr:A disintegrin and metalloproteinase with thrombospondin motifs 16 [Plakobranchus ocellatus]
MGVSIGWAYPQLTGGLEARACKQEKLQDESRGLPLAAQRKMSRKVITSRGFPPDTGQGRWGEKAKVWICGRDLPSCLKKIPDHGPARASRLLFVNYRSLYRNLVGRATTTFTASFSI